MVQRSTLKIDPYCRCRMLFCLIVVMLLILFPCRVEAGRHTKAKITERDTVHKGNTDAPAALETMPEKRSGLSVDRDPTKMQRGFEPQMEEIEPPDPEETTRSAPREKASETDSALPADRDPTKIKQEFESQMEEIEPPEIRITGIIEVEGQKAAIAELNLEDFEGMVMLEPGATVSIPKPNRGKSESKRWMTYFTVIEILQNGVLLVMENGEQIWTPVMGEKD